MAEINPRTPILVGVAVLISLICLGLQTRQSAKTMQASPEFQLAEVPFEVT